MADKPQTYSNLLEAKALTPESLNQATDLFLSLSKERDDREIEIARQWREQRANDPTCELRDQAAMENFVYPNPLNPPLVHPKVAERIMARYRELCAAAGLEPRE